MATGSKAAPGSQQDDILAITAEDQEILEEGRTLASPNDRDIEEPYLGTPTSNRSTDKTSLISQRLHNFHQKTPILKSFPSFVILPISILILVNLCVWAIVAILLRYHP
jgi:hypothetical protein